MKTKILFKGLFVIGFLFLFNKWAYSWDPINTYWKVGGYFGSVVGIDLASQKGALHTLAVGDLVLIIQMDGATIDPMDGHVTNLNDAGNYEFSTIVSIDGTGSLISLANVLTKSYDATNHVQLIWVPSFGYYNPQEVLAPYKWDGEVGGVLAIAACHLILGEGVTAQGLGFRGGEYGLGSPRPCSNNTDMNYTSLGLGGRKGEGIGFISGLEYGTGIGRGSAGNGGGGGNSYNSGGAGGSNFGDGGHGGDELKVVGHTCYDGEPIGGIVSPGLGHLTDRVFMGGGGGAGHIEAGTQEASGKDGGGIIIIRAGTLTIGYGIGAGGLGGGVVTDNGGGGGGGGGSILLDVDVFDEVYDIIDVTGGPGVNTDGQSLHGPGGGGGGGRIGFSGFLIPTNSYDVSGGGAGSANVGTHGATNGEDGAIFTGLDLGIDLAVPVIDFTVEVTGCTDPSIILTPSSIVANEENVFIEVRDDQIPPNMYYLEPGGWVENSTEIDLSSLNLPCGHTYTVKFGANLCGYLEVEHSFTVPCNPIVTVVDEFGNEEYTGCDRTLTIQLDAETSGGTEPYTYAWGIIFNPNLPPGLNNPFEEDPELSEAEALNAAYVVIVTDANDCSSGDFYNNNIVDCCLKYEHPPYVQIDNNWINSYVFPPNGTEIIFPEKCFVTEMITIPSGLRVNINNCEVVFKDQNSGIRFWDYSQIDAQNSEFKPCEPTDFWNGLRFSTQLHRSANKGVIHECVFTNAFIAVRVGQAAGTGGRLADLDIVNNEFFNCIIGVALLSTDFDGSIAGNAFHQLILGVVLFNSTANRTISDNRFTNDAPFPQFPFLGIASLQSSFVASNNEFTNMFRCLLTFQNTDPVIFEDNNIQYTQVYNVPASIHAVDVLQNEAFVLIKGNEMNGRVFNDPEDGLDHVAVYTEDATMTFISDNAILGFEDAIQIINPLPAPPDEMSTLIARNTISDFSRFGIFTQGGTDVFVYNNDITTTRFYPSDDAVGFFPPQTGIVFDDTYPFMAYYNSINMDGIWKEQDNYPNTVTTFSTAIGIECRTNGHHAPDPDDPQDLSPESAIVENCIHETGRAINFLQQQSCDIISGGIGVVLPCRIPRIINNYMYNYCEAGISFENGRYVGTIGIADAPVGSGRNMFVSNYVTQPLGAVWGGAVDVIGPPLLWGPVDMWGNSNNLVLTGHVNDNGNHITSTASCGNYVGNDELNVNGGGRKIDPMLFNFRFQDKYEKYYPIELEVDDYVLRGNYQSEMNKVASPNRLTYLKFLHGILDNNATYTGEVDKLIQFSNTSGYLSVHDQFMFNYFVAIQANQWQTAEYMLNGFVATDADDVDFITLQRIELAMFKGQGDPFSLSETNQTILAEIDARRGIYAAPARGLLNLTTGAHDYIFAKIPDGNYRYKFTAEGAEAESLLDIYPNPADSKITVRYYLNDDVNNAELTITNMLGEKLVTQPLYALSSEMQISLQHIPAGVYVVNVTNNGKKVKAGKLVIE